jgi:hypothetical protein
VGSVGLCDTSFSSLIGASFATTSTRISLSRISTRAGPLETFDCSKIILSGIILRFAPCFLSLGNIRKRIWKKADGDVFDLKNFRNNSRGE